MKKYLVIQKTSIERFQAAINDLHGDGYELTDFQVAYDADSLCMFFGVMELKEPQKPQRFYLEPMVG